MSGLRITTRNDTGPCYYNDGRLLKGMPSDITCSLARKLPYTLDNGRRGRRILSRRSSSDCFGGTARQYHWRCNLSYREGVVTVEELASSRFYQLSCGYNVLTSSVGFNPGSLSTGLRHALHTVQLGTNQDCASLIAS